MPRLSQVFRARVGSGPVAAAVATMAVLVAATVVVTAAVGAPAIRTLAAVPAAIRPASPPEAATPSTTPTAGPSASPSPTTAPSGGGGGGGRAAEYPPDGSGQWSLAGAGPSLGGSGTLRTYQVAVETTVPESVAAFAALVDSTLGDPRGWTSSGFRFARVSGAANFTVYLASPWTAHRLCGSIDTRVDGFPYTSCQNGANVVINADRYFYGTWSHFTAPLSVYRQYVINHEVGHRLGKGHIGCPGRGRPAPVMMQQTIRLDGCLPNAWPNPHIPPPPPTTDPQTTEPTQTQTADPTGTQTTEPTEPTGTPTDTESDPPSDDPTPGDSTSTTTPGDADPDPA